MIKLSIFTLAILLSANCLANEDQKIIKNPPLGFDNEESVINIAPKKGINNLNLKNPPLGFDEIKVKNNEENAILSNDLENSNNKNLQDSALNNETPDSFNKNNDYDESEILSVAELKEKCYQNHAVSCYHAGELLLESDPNIATEMFRYGCALQDGYNCLKLAKNYEAGLGIKANLEKAQKLYKKACELDKTACR